MRAFLLISLNFIFLCFFLAYSLFNSPSVYGDIGPWPGSKGGLPGGLTGWDKDAEGADDVDVPGGAVDGESADEGDFPTATE